MRFSILSSFLLLFGMLRVQAAPLSQAELEELRERLEKITESASTQLDKRFKGALDDFRAAVQDDGAALELYYKCVEKANFTDKQKKSQDFRDWKRNHEDKHRDPKFRQALRHQLNWLCLSLRASIRPEDQDKLIPELIKALRDLYGNADALKGQHELLSQDVRSSVFFIAYELGEMKAEQWPGSPMNVAAAFDSILMPPARTRRDYADLARMWDERIKMEIAKTSLKEEVDKPTGLSRPGKPSPKMEEFQETTLPQLLWLKQMDLFKAGDEKNAALALLKHLSENIGDVHAKEWAEEFQALIAPTAPKEPTTTPSP